MPFAAVELQTLTTCVNKISFHKRFLQIMKLTHLIFALLTDLKEKKYYKFLPTCLVFYLLSLSSEMCFEVTDLGF